MILYHYNVPPVSCQHELPRVFQSFGPFLQIFRRLYPEAGGGRSGPHIP